MGTEMRILKRTEKGALVVREWEGGNNEYFWVPVEDSKCVTELYKFGTMQASDYDAECTRATVRGDLTAPGVVHRTLWLTAGGFLVMSNLAWFLDFLGFPAWHPGHWILLAASLSWALWFPLVVPALRWGSRVPSRLGVATGEFIDGGRRADARRKEIDDVARRNREAAAAQPNTLSLTERGQLSDPEDSGKWRCPM